VYNRVKSKKAEGG
jgi:hypothetical protein